MFLRWKQAAIAMAGLPPPAGAVASVTSLVLVLDHRSESLSQGKRGGTMVLISRGPGVMMARSPWQTGRSSVVVART